MSEIVLTADRTLMTDYNGLTPMGHFACLPDRLMPNFVLKYVLPKLDENQAPYTLRRVEASLVDSGFDVSIVRPQEINKIKKIKPRVVSISTVDPVTTKPHPWTLSNIFGGGEAVTEHEFYSLLVKINDYRKKMGFKIIIGGPGASEFKRSEKYHTLFDTYVIGAAEGSTELFRKALNNEPLPKKYQASMLHQTDFPIIKGASRCGHVQITQGCPRGCHFCVPTLNNWLSFPIERILKEISINLQAGIHQISLITEDILLYGSTDVEVNHNAIMKLMTHIQRYKEQGDIETVNISNVSIAATIKGKKTVHAMTDVLGVSKECMIDTIIGLETGSERLLKRYMEGKTKPFNPDCWHDLAIDAINILTDHDWYPICSLITGLPEENEEDVIKTLNLVDDLKGNMLMYYIFYFVPMGKLEGSNFFNFNDITTRRWELFSTCWMETIRSLRTYIHSFKNTFFKLIILHSMREIEKDLRKYKNDPFGFRNAYDSVNLKGLHLLPFLARRFIEH